MSAFDTETAEERDARVSGADESPDAAEKSDEGGHSRWVMIACCVPMLAIAGALVATGVASAGLLVVAVMCTAMMAMMMVGMSHGDGGGR